MRVETLSTWPEFRSYIQRSRNMLPVYWRGQSNADWPLASAFERTILAMNGGSERGASTVFPYEDRYPPAETEWWRSQYVWLRDRFLERFKEAASGLRGPNPSILDTIGWWALGRHHGLISPLLDWTTKPYIAAFFALQGAFEHVIQDLELVSGNEVAIYRLTKAPSLDDDQALHFVQVSIDELPHLQGQRGVFTWLDSLKYFELQGYLDDTARGDLLTKIVLRGSAIIDGMAELDEAGIDHRLLFPDLHGAAQYSNSQEGRASAVLWSSTYGKDFLERDT